MANILEATAIVLTDEERAELETLARSTKSGFRLRQRAWIVLLAATQITLSKATICSRSFERASNIGYMIGVTSGRSATRAFHEVFSS